MLAGFELKASLRRGAATTGDGGFDPHQVVLLGQFHKAVVKELNRFINSEHV